MNVAVSVPAFTSAWLEKLDFSDTAILDNHYTYALEVDGETVSAGSVLFTAPKHYHFEDPRLEARIEGDEIVVTAECYARSVEIDSPDGDLILSDNYFDMEAGSRRVKILKGQAKALTLRSVYDIR